MLTPTRLATLAALALLVLGGTILLTPVLDGPLTHASVGSGSDRRRDVAREGPSTDPHTPDPDTPDLDNPGLDTPGPPNTDVFWPPSPSSGREGEAGPTDAEEGASGPGDPEPDGPGAGAGQIAMTTDPDAPGWAAAAFAEAFARPSAPVSDELWWAGVAPLLTSQGRHDYLGTDPALVGYTAVLGLVGGPDGRDVVTLAPGSPIPDVPSAEAGIVSVGVVTDAGIYVVNLTPGPAGEWLAAGITPLDPLTDPSEYVAGTA
ncbi:MAG: hypothetical protein ACK5MT_14180 [Actinomycetales bacterium]